MSKPQKTSTGRGQRTCGLVYGLPGIGKTRLMGSGSKSTLILHPPTDHVDSIPPDSEAEHVEVSDHAGLLEQFQALQQRADGYDHDVVVLDGITLMEEYGMDDVFQAAVDRNPHRAQFGWDKGEYGINRSRLTKWLRDMVGLSKSGQFDFWVTAHVMDWDDPVSGDSLWVPAFGSAKTNLSAKLCGYMNVVAYYGMSGKKGEENRTLLVDADGFIGKDQYDCFPKLKSGRHGFVNPTLSDVEAAIAKGRPAARTRKRRSGTTAKRRTRKTQS